MKSTIWCTPQSTGKEGDGVRRRYRIPVPKKNEESDYYKQILNAVRDVEVMIEWMSDA